MTSHSVELNFIIREEQKSLDSAVSKYAFDKGLSFSEMKKMKFHLVKQDKTLFILSRAFITAIENLKLTYKAEKFKIPIDFSKKCSIEKLPFVTTVQEAEGQLYKAVKKALFVDPEKRDFQFLIKKKKGLFLLSSKVCSAIRVVLKIWHTEFSHEKALEVFSGCPKNKAQFVKDIKKTPQIILEKASEKLAPVEEESKERDILPTKNSYEYRGVSYLFSKEIQQGLQGNRGLDHQVEVQVLEKCLQKKHSKMRKAISDGKERRFEYYFFLKEHDKVLNIVVQFFPSKQSKAKQSKEKLPNLLLLTAYYPKRNVLFRRLKFTDATYDIWRKNLPGV